MFHLGLTGSIGMGKSTTAKMFAEEGCAVWDADAAVHRLYAKGGAAVAPMRAAFPTAIEAGAVSRAALKEIIAADPTALPRTFLAEAQSDIAVLDIPLLFETGGDAAMDAVVCVTIPDAVQRDRVLARGTMTEAQFDAIRAKQMPAKEKCARSDYVIVTDTPDHARAQVRDVIRDIREKLRHA